jgi:integrase
MQGAPPKVIQELAGHTTLAMTMRYMHLAPGHTDAAIRLLDHRPDSENPGAQLGHNSGPEKESSAVQRS